MSGLPPLVAVSLKMYLGVAATRRWVAAIAEVAARLETAADVELAVLPTFPLLESTAETLAGTGIRWGAQDVAPSADGAQTGEVSATVLAELGCRYVEIAHAERRRLFGEDDAMIAAKVVESLDAGLVPIYCVGEVDRGDPQSAVQVCLRQLESLLEVAAGREVVVAYEPVWAIGASHPAQADYVTDICRHLQIRLDSYPGPARVLYGGSAGPGTYEDLRSAVDGLFLGRFAHDPGAWAQVVAEVLSSGRRGRHGRQPLTSTKETS
jgi:triosephosphate isomerase